MLRNKKLLMLFSKGMSVEKWDKLGMLSREVDIYSRLAKYFQEVWWYTYGKNDHTYKGRLRDIKLFSADEEILKLVRNYDDYDNKVLKKYYNFFERFDYVKTNQFSTAPLGLKFKKHFGTRFVIRQGFFYPLRHRLIDKHVFKTLYWFITKEKNIYKAADAILLTSEEAKKYLSQTYHICERKIYVIQNYINTDIFRSIHSISKRPNSLLYIGRFSYSKNLKNLSKGIVGLPVSLTLVGDGKYKEKIERFRKKYRLDINIINRVDNFKLPGIYNSHEIFVLPSYFESNPKVLLEAMACGMTCIGADSYGINNIIKDRVNGLLCGRDAESIRDAIKESITNDELKKRLSKNAQLHILKHNDINKEILKEIAIYEKIL